MCAAGWMYGSDGICSATLAGGLVDDASEIGLINQSSPLSTHSNWAPGVAVGDVLETLCPGAPGTTGT
ncbi:Fc receptor-like protein 6 [Anopheles sinensis]|uniref:Fc receptor-like protein 6 n=1 Tax=Anopheles sinensis TaxID=74873 RepID=A0A084VLD2_ANOSI|nr:Fc receptor-like protein 6 [Anopheles sinensis]